MNKITTITLAIGLLLLAVLFLPNRLSENAPQKTLEQNSSDKEILNHSSTKVINEVPNTDTGKRKLLASVSKAPVVNTNQKRHENNGSSSSYSITTDDSLAQVLRDVPEEYHSFFQWDKKNNGTFTAEYQQLLSEQEQQKNTNIDLERNLSQAIYQHELGTMVTVEKISCTQSACEVLGQQNMSNVFNQINSSLQQEEWWQFSGQTLKNGVSENGKVIFLAVYYR